MSSLISSEEILEIVDKKANSTTTATATATATAAATVTATATAAATATTIAVTTTAVTAIPAIVLTMAPTAAIGISFQNNEALANEYFAKQEFIQALNHYQLALDEKPNDLHLLNLKAITLRKLGRFQEALSIYYFLASNYFDKKEYARVLENYRDAYRLYSWLKNKRNIASLLVPKPATATATATVVATPTATAMASPQSTTTEQSKKQADSGFSNSEASDNHDLFVICHHCGVAYYYLERYPEALENLDAALKYQQNDYNSLHYKSLTLYKLNEFPLMLSCLEQMRALNKKSINVHYNLGVGWYSLARKRSRLGDFNKALKYFKLITSLDVTSKIGTEAEQMVLQDEIYKKVANGNSAAVNGSKELPNGNKALANGNKELPHKTGAPILNASMMASAIAQLTVEIPAIPATPATAATPTTSATPSTTAICSAKK